MRLSDLQQLVNILGLAQPHLLVRSLVRGQRLGRKSTMLQIFLFLIVVNKITYWILDT